MLIKSNIMLGAMLGSAELVNKWWESPNKAFNKLCPKDVDIEDVYKYLLDFFK